MELALERGRVRRQVPSRIAQDHPLVRAHAPKLHRQSQAQPQSHHGRATGRQRDDAAVSLVVEQDRVLARRRRESPLGRAENPHARELDPGKRVDSHHVDPAPRERARGAREHVL